MSAQGLNDALKVTVSLILNLIPSAKNAAASTEETTHSLLWNNDLNISEFGYWLYKFFCGSLWEIPHQGKVILFV